MISNKSFWAKIALFTATIIWGFAFIVVKNTVDIFPPLILIALRFTIAFVILSLLYIRKLKEMDKKCFISGVVIGIMLFLAYSAQTFGAADTTPGKSAFLTSVYCVMVPFLFWGIKRKNPGICSFIAAFMCVLGTALVALRGDLKMGAGDLSTLLCSFFFACHIVAIALLGSDKDPVLITILQFGTAAVLAWFTGLPMGEVPICAPLSSWLGIVFLGIFPTMIGFLLQTVGQRYTTPSAAALILSLESVFGVLFSLIFGFDTLNLRLLCGFVLIFAAIIVSETKLSFIKRKKQL